MPSGLWTAPYSSVDTPPVAGAVQPGSVFTSALVAGIRTGEADRDRDGHISVDEAFEYAYDELRAATGSSSNEYSVPGTR